MSNIEKSTAIEKLPLGLRKFTELRIGSPCIKNLSINERKRQCYDIITRAHLACGTKGNDSDVLVFQTNELLGCLNDKYGELTAGEVERSFEMLIAGEFGPFMGLFKKSYYQALKCYYELPQRVQGMKQYLELMNQENKTELTPSEKRAKSFDAVEYFFKEYKETGKILTGHFQIYQFLMDEGKIKWTKEEKNAISGPIKEAYKKEIETSYKRGKVRKTDYELILSSLESNPTLIGRVRHEALKRYFDKLINEGKELSSLIG